MPHRDEENPFISRPKVAATPIQQHTRATDADYQLPQSPSSEKSAASAQNQGGADELKKLSVSHVASAPSSTPTASLLQKEAQLARSTPVHNPFASHSKIGRSPTIPRVTSQGSDQCTERTEMSVGEEPRSGTPPQARRQTGIFGGKQLARTPPTSHTQTLVSSQESIDPEHARSVFSLSRRHSAVLGAGSGVISWSTTVAA